MRYYSSLMVYYYYKVFAFAFSLLFACAGILELYYTELTTKTILNSIALSAFSVFLFIVVYKINERFVQVSITKEYMMVLKDSLRIRWREVDSVRFRWYGLYQLKIGDDYYLFPSSDLGINLFGHKLFMDEFDDLITRVKKDNGI